MEVRIHRNGFQLYSQITTQELNGPPPLDILKQGKESSRYFDDEGKFKFPELIPKSQGLENSFFASKDMDRRMFLNFISRMLRWRPADRSNTEALLLDPWLQER
ncbi:hypothetical protein V1507DRAFT_259375 [Lipomyces tetrasporus]